MMDLNNSKKITASNFANIMGVSKATLEKWEENGTYVPQTCENGEKFFLIENLMHVPEIASMVTSKWEEEMSTVPLRDFYSVELFAGAGGLALGMEKAGFKHVLLNEFDPHACNTLRLNRPDWHVVEGDVEQVDFTHWRGKVDFLSGGFPCQAFSYAGKGGGFNDTRGTLFFQLARAVKEIQPKVFMGENVRGLAAHDNGRTLETIKNTIKELGYTLIEPRILKAIYYQVPQKRERLILIAIRNDYADKVNFSWPDPYHRVVTLRDAFFKGELYAQDVPVSVGQSYPEKKKKVMELVPEGGDWRNLPEDVQKEYMGASFYLGGGKTGMARRLSMDEPSLTLTCAPAQKQTERCHPLETRPLTIREYARIQTFPDDWSFAGNMTAQYKQIGNAVPVNLAWAIGRSIMRLMNQIEQYDRLHNKENITTEIDNKPYLKNAKIYHTAEGEVAQLSLFEPESLYICPGNQPCLIGTCRQANRTWIFEKMMYNYPVTEQELEQHPELWKVKKLLIIYRKKATGYFNVTSLELVDKSWLAGKDYPIKSSKHKSDTQYLLFHLSPCNEVIPTIRIEDCKQILGKILK